MLLTIQENFPNIKTFVLVGHSAGGQLLSRYVLSNTVHDKLIASGCKIRYVIANSSSFVYLDKYRPNLEEDSGFIEIIQNPCEKNNFNDWKYGLENIDLYPSKTPVKEMISNLKNRDVVFLQGSEDVNTDHSSLDKRCEGMLQGKNRLERGLRYFEYLGFYYGKEIYLNKHLDLINGISHSNNDIFQSSIGRHWIFNF